MDQHSAGRSFEATFLEEYPKMVALAAAVCGNRLWAEDIAQDAFVKLNRQWQSVSSYDKPGAWLRRVTLNLAISRRRRLALEAKWLLKQKDTGVAIAPEPDVDGSVWAAVRSLPPKQRAAIALRYLEDRSFEEIAEIMDIGASTARTHLQRAHESLRDTLGRDSIEQHSIERYDYEP